jgi:sec-independent protein translocase protein TatC
VFPGLTAKERRAVLDGFGFAVVLFALGVTVGYRMILGVTLQWMFQINEWLGVKIEFVTVAPYVSFVLKMLLGFGLAFEFPIIILVLAQVGLVTSALLRGKRRHVAVILLIVSAIITPSVDPFTQTLLAAPLYLLYEMSIVMVWFMERRRRRSEAAA